MSRKTIIIVWLVGLALASFRLAELQQAKAFLAKSKATRNSDRGSG